MVYRYNNLRYVYISFAFGLITYGKQRPQMEYRLKTEAKICYLDKFT